MFDKILGFIFDNEHILTFLKVLGIVFLVATMIVLLGLSILSLCGGKIILGIISGIFFLILLSIAITLGVIAEENCW